MFYCETCRVQNSWPKGLSRSFGRCEDCGNKIMCYDVPSGSLPLASAVKKVVLTPVNEPDFTIDQLQGAKNFRVVRVVINTSQRVVLHYRPSDDLTNPAIDPLIIGTVVKETTPVVPMITSVAEYQVRILWDNKLWKAVDDDVAGFLGLMSGVKASDLKDLKEKLDSGRLGHDDRGNVSPGPGRTGQTP